MANFSVGYITFTNYAYFDNKNLLIESSTIGAHLGLGYDSKINKSIALGMGSGITFGSLSKFKNTSGTTTQTLSVDKNHRENISRVDLYLGIRIFM